MATPYTVHRLSHPVSPASLGQYTALRLLALRTDPDAFSSTYAREVAFTESQWRARLDSDDKATFIVSFHTLENGEEKKAWVGTLSMLSPTELQKIAFSPPSDMAMWVHPEHRRCGLGQLLIKAGCKWAGENKTVVLLVNERNREARRLYEKAGFVMRGKEGEIWMALHVHEEVDHAMWVA